MVKEGSEDDSRRISQINEAEGDLAQDEYKKI